MAFISSPSNIEDAITNTLETEERKKQLNVTEGRKSRANRPDRSFSTEQVHFSRR